MKINLAGRLRKVRLGLTHPLYPLFEAIVNSIDAIREIPGHRGTIRIRIHRIISPQLIAENAWNPIEGFTVEDDGVGFNEKNFRSFDTSDTLEKAEMGAKGVGRFLWLKAFDQVRITSRFKRNGKIVNRSFGFSEEKDGIFDPVEAETHEQGNLTRVELHGLRVQYNNKHLPKKAKTIGERIIDHCLFFFLRPDCPAMLIEDDDEKATLNLNQLFNEQARVGEKTPLNVKGHELTVQAVRLYAGDRNEHLVHLCAHDREVEAVRIEDYIPSLNRKLKDTDGKSFVYAAYVGGSFLDEYVNQERTRIDFPKADELFGEVPSEEELVRGVLV